MSGVRTIKSLLYETIHRSKKQVAQIADESGISANYLYRAGLPLDESGVKFPVEYLVALMKATKNYSLLKHLAGLCGFVLVKEPRYKGYKGDEIDLVNEYQDATTAAVRSLKLFLEQPGMKTYQLAKESLDKVMEQTVGAKKYAHKKASGQLEFDL